MGGLRGTVIAPSGLSAAWLQYTSDPDGKGGGSDGSGHGIITDDIYPEHVMAPNGCPYPQKSFLMEDTQTHTVAPGSTLIVTAGGIFLASELTDGVPKWHIGQYGITTDGWDDASSWYPSRADSISGDNRHRSFHTPIYSSDNDLPNANRDTMFVVDAGFIQTSNTHDEDGPLHMEAGVTMLGTNDPAVQKMNESHGTAKYNGFALNDYLSYTRRGVFSGEVYNRGVKVRLMAGDALNPTGFDSVSRSAIRNTGEAIADNGTTVVPNTSQYPIVQYGTRCNDAASESTLMIRNDGSTARTITVRIVVRGRAVGLPSATTFAEYDPGFFRAVQAEKAAPVFAARNSFVGAALSMLAPTVLPLLGKVVGGLGKTVSSFVPKMLGSLIPGLDNRPPARDLMIQKLRAAGMPDSQIARVLGNG